MWYDEFGPEGDVVLSSRIRLARNIKGIPFPPAADDARRSEVIEICKEAAKTSCKDLNFIDFGNMKDHERTALAECHLISPQMLDNEIRHALLLSGDSRICVMINEEDHIRIQSMAPGFDLDSCFAEANRVDDELEQSLDYAFDEQLGYLTCCPTNVGTGMRASVMMHLPGLVMSGMISKISATLSQLGLAVRGIYGEGSKAEGNIFQISNQLTLGASEEDIITKFKQIIVEVIEKERAARERLHEVNKFRLEDAVMRSYGILKSAVIMTSQEAIKRISDVRLGISIGLIDDVSYQTMNKISYLVMPANIMKNFNISDPNERDLKRAEIIKEQLKDKE